MWCIFSDAFKQSPEMLEQFSISFHLKFLNQPSSLILEYVRPQLKKHDWQRYQSFLSVSYIPNFIRKYHQNIRRNSSGVWMIVMFCAIWCHLYNFKKVKNAHGGVLLNELKITKKLSSADLVTVRVIPRISGLNVMRDIEWFWRKRETWSPKYVKIAQSR